jgi:hypothetical protein
MLGFPLGILSAAGAAVGEVGTYELISSTILGGTAASVTFSNLGDYSSTYKHLQIRQTARSADNAETGVTVVRFNGDTGSNYNYHRLLGEGSSVLSQAATNATFVFAGGNAGNTTTANAFGAGVIDILDAFSTTKNRTVRTLSGISVSGMTLVSIQSGAWRNTNSITSITALANTGTLAAGSRFSLYGIKG